MKVNYKSQDDGIIYYKSFWIKRKNHLYILQNFPYPFTSIAQAKERVDMMHELWSKNESNYKKLTF